MARYGPTYAVEIAERTIEISNPDKPLYPGAGITKRDVADYYHGVAEVVLPHLRDRPLTLRRFPDGIDENGFFQKEASEHFPNWVRTVEVPQRTQSGVVHHVVCDDAATLIYLANQACLEFHCWLSPAQALDHPDRMVVDLDPADGIGVPDLRETARGVRALMHKNGLAAFVQTTGGRGYHVVAPLDGSTVYDEIRTLARRIADEMAAEDPQRLTTEQRKDRRGERIFLDTARNAYGQTAVAPYSLRARAGAPVATPIDWSELGRVEPASYTITNIDRRLVQKSDPWARLSEYGRA